MFLKYALVFTVIVFLTSCSQLLYQGEVEEPFSEQSSSGVDIKISGQQQDRYHHDKDLIISIDNSLKYLNRIDSQKIVWPQKGLLAQDIIYTLEDLKAKVKELGEGDELYDYIKKNYKFYSYGNGNTHVTGYYEAELKGSRKKTKVYRYPLYSKPNDILKIELKKFPQFKDRKDVPDSLQGRITSKGKVGPYYTRKEIDYGKALMNKGAELVWVDDPMALFFLQVQGSGIIELTDGSKMRVNFAGNNGHPYRSIGKFLIDRGKLSKKNMSAQVIRKYLKTHPNEAQAVYEYNPSYVFFREVEEGPLGCLGVPVTAYRSIATDPKYFPQALPAILMTKIPVVDSDGVVLREDDFAQIVLNQDSGGAIKGQRRVDLFTGKGEQNEQIAGGLNGAGRLFFFVKK